MSPCLDHRLNHLILRELHLRIGFSFLAGVDWTPAPVDVMDEDDVLLLLLLLFVVLSFDALVAVVFELLLLLLLLAVLLLR